jgi:predicted ribosome-associated RNA-binding protein Tma20
MTARHSHTAPVAPAAATAGVRAADARSPVQPQFREVVVDKSAVRRLLRGVMKADIVETKDRLHTVERGSTRSSHRLSNLEGLVVENVRETRAVMQVVKQHGHRLDSLEPPTP